MINNFFFLATILFFPFHDFHVTHATFHYNDQSKSMEITIKVAIEDLEKSINKTRCIVSAEEHNFLGGLGESISRVLTKNDPVPQEFVATNDTFGDSGPPSKLMDKYGLNSNAIINAIEKVLTRK